MRLARLESERDRSIFQAIYRGQETVVAAKEAPGRDERLAIELDVAGSPLDLELEGIRAGFGSGESTFPGVRSGL